MFKVAPVLKKKRAESSQHLPQGKRKTFNKMRLDPRRAAVSTETPIQIPGGGTSPWTATSQSQLPCSKDPENRKGIHRTWGGDAGNVPGVACSVVQTWGLPGSTDISILRAQRSGIKRNEPLEDRNECRAPAVPARFSSLINDT